MLEKIVKISVQMYREHKLARSEIFIRDFAFGAHTVDHFALHKDTPAYSARALYDFGNY